MIFFKVPFGDYFLFFGGFLSKSKGFCDVLTVLWCSWFCKFFFVVAFKGICLIGYYVSLFFMFLCFPEGYSVGMSSTQGSWGCERCTASDGLRSFLQGLSERGWFLAKPRNNRFVKGFFKVFNNLHDCLCWTKQIQQKPSLLKFFKNHRVEDALGRMLRRPCLKRCCSSLWILKLGDLDGWSFEEAWEVADQQELV